MIEQRVSPNTEQLRRRVVEQLACPRCGNVTMEYRHQSLQCPGCQWKEGCCEGAPQEESNARD